MSLVRVLRMRVPAGMAKPGPAIGQVLGPLGINMMEFCKKFNEDTKHIIAGTPMPTEFSAYSDRSFTYKLNTPTTMHFLKCCAGIQKGSKNPGHESCGQVGLKALYEIALIKKDHPSMFRTPLEGVCRSVAATALSMGLEIVDDRMSLQETEDEDE